MKRQFDRIPGEAYRVDLVAINGKRPESSHDILIENICKGGFRFQTHVELQLEDRLQVMLHFPDGRQQEVFGRICYGENLPEGFAYGFSVLSGFYNLTRAA